MTTNVEYVKQPFLVFQPLSDFHFNSIHRDVSNAGIKCNLATLRSRLESDFSPRFNPFTYYFSNLSWDGTTDFIQSLADTVIVPPDDKVWWSTCLKKWLVAMAGSLVDDKTVNQTVIVFSGEQGLGKTTWVQSLVPEELKTYLYNGTINPDNKDTLTYLSECMLINLDELEGLNKTKTDSLKDLITKPTIKVRKAYAHSPESLVRRASFIGSVNGTEFLSDITGSRRFLCFGVEKIDYKHSIPIREVLGQAFYLFTSGYKHWFSDDEVQEIHSRNECFRQRSLEEQLVTKYFQPCSKEAGNRFLAATDILKHISSCEGIPFDQSSCVRMGKALKALGFIKVKKSGISKYIVNEIIPIRDTMLQSSIAA